MALERKPMERIHDTLVEVVGGMDDDQVADLEGLLDRDHLYLLFSRRGHRAMREAIDAVRKARTDASEA